MMSAEKRSLILADFDYDLPESLIAQEPCDVRDHSRLMVMNRKSGLIEHRLFSDIGQYLVPGDLLVVNNTKVFPCRLIGRKRGGGRAEIFLLAEREANIWNALVKGGLSTGKTVTLRPGIDAEIIAENDDGTRDVRFSGVGDIRTLLPEIGRTPLPPYIKREPVSADKERYQTVYAMQEGAVAAPTAGLHFTPELLKRLEAKRVQQTAITLHVGPGTFQPVKTEVITGHRMHPEQYNITEDAASAMNQARAEGRRVIAVGTTSVRTMESAAAGDGQVHPGTGRSDLFIYPGFRFEVTGGMITNFHLPKSTLLMLVAAFAGREQVLAAYKTAVYEKYRFYSYGDAMLIL